MTYLVPTVAQIKKDLEEKGALFNVVSLFAGGGGSSTGYRMARGNVLAVNEFIPEAVTTYKSNWENTIVFEKDVRNLTPNEILSAIHLNQGELDIMDGSPPCCAFSVSGARDKLWGKDHKYSDSKQGNIEDLFFEYLRILDGLQPKVCVAENVVGLKTGVSKGYLNEIFRGFDKAGYVVRAKAIDAKNLGVPQSRPRLFFVGVRKDLWLPEFENKTHPLPLKTKVTLREAFEGIEDLTDEEKRQTDCSKYAIYTKLVTVPKGFAHPKAFNLKKANPNSVSNCLTAKAGDISAYHVYHWDNRAYTIREAKRVMSVPDDYIITGTYAQQMERLGRMVAPLVMKAIAENIYTNILSKLK